MKRSFYLILAAISILSATPCSAQRAAAPNREGLCDTDYDYPLYGNVSSIKVSTYKLVDKFGAETKGDFLGSHVIHFNSKGDVTSAHVYLGEGVTEICTYAYDSQGRITSINSKDADSGSYEGKTVMKYGSNGKMSQCSRYMANGSLYSRDMYTYDSNNRIIREQSYSGDGTFLLKTSYSYGSNGKVSTEICYDDSNTISYKKVFVYDSYKNLVKFTSYEQNGSIIYEETYKYDGKGYLILSTEMERLDINKVTYKYRYDSRGYVIEKRSYIGDALIPDRIEVYTISYR